MLSLEEPEALGKSSWLLIYGKVFSLNLSICSIPWNNTIVVFLARNHNLYSLQLWIIEMHTSKNARIKDGYTIQTDWPG